MPPRARVISILIGAASVACMSGVLGTEAEAQVGVRVNPAPLTGAINQSLNAVNNQVSRGLTQMSTSVNRGIGQINTSVNRGLNAMNSYVYQPPVQMRYPSYRTSYRPTSLANRASTAARSSYYTPQTLNQPTARQTQRMRLSEEQIAILREHQAKAAKTQAGLGILSADSLARLNDTQTGLQNAAQNAAFDAQIGEIIEWTYEGVSGSARAVSESRFGTMYCREFKQTLTMDGNTEIATATACRRGNGQWARSAY